MCTRSEPWLNERVRMSIHAVMKEEEMSDEAAIRDVIKVYFDSMYQSSSDKVHQAFHPSAAITGYLGGALQEMTVDAFADLVAGNQPSDEEKGEPAVLEVLSLDIAGDTAVARVRDVYLGTTFLDTLSLLKVDGQWCIYNKLFHVENT